MDYAAQAERMTAQADQAGAVGAQAFKDSVDQAAHVGNRALKETMEKSLFAMNEVNAQAKRNLEAVVASMSAATRGAETLNAQAMAFTKRSVEGQVEQAKALTAARSVQEVIELQTTYVRSAMEACVAEFNRASETLSALIEDSFRPLNERATVLAETFQSAR